MYPKIPIVLHYHKNDLDIDYNHDTGIKLGNLIVVLSRSKNLQIFDMHIAYCRYCQLGFSSKIEVPQLNSAQLGTFIARLSSSRKIPA